MHFLCGRFSSASSSEQRRQRLFVSAFLHTLTAYHLNNFAVMILVFLSFTIVFIQTFFLIFLIVFFYYSHGLTAQNCLLLLFSIMTKSLMQELTSTFILSSLLPVSSGSLTVFAVPSACDLNVFKRRFSRHHLKRNWNLDFYIYILHAKIHSFFLLFLFASESASLMKKNKVIN